MYGIWLYLVKDREGMKINLVVVNMGILVFQGFIKINVFNWVKVWKLSFKRKCFFIKFWLDVNSVYQDILEFLMVSWDFCKFFWKICVEYYVFFRFFEEFKLKFKFVFFSWGLLFWFSGWIQKQVLDYVKEGGYKKVQFERKYSKIYFVWSFVLQFIELNLEVLEEFQQSVSFIFGEGVEFLGGQSCQ